MTSLARLSQRFASLQEISGIMTAMKSLSLVETRKLSHFIRYQQQMLANVEAAAADFLRFFPGVNQVGSAQSILFLVGSERGFCGNFNERILAAMEDVSGWEPAPVLLVMGRRLAAKLEGHPGVFAAIAGPTVAEEVPSVLERAMDTLDELGSRIAGGDVALYALAHGEEADPVLTRLLPLAPPEPPPLSQPPQLQLAPDVFFPELLDQYLLASLHGLLYQSLAAENHQRLNHMERALDRLAETLTRLSVKRNALRQEKIVEEIEVILSGEEAFVEGE